MALTPEQQANARIIFDAGVKMGLDVQTIAAGVATAKMESGLKNVNYGDRDSLGLFQQRANWGSAQERTTPAIAARKFFEAYVKSTGDTVLERIANTQRPAEKYRNEYAKHFGDAEEVVASFTGMPTPHLTGARPAQTGTLPVAAVRTGSDPAAPAVAGDTGHSEITVGPGGTLQIAPVDELPPDASPRTSRTTSGRTTRRPPPTSRTPRSGRSSSDPTSTRWTKSRSRRRSGTPATGRRTAQRPAPTTPSSAATRTKLAGSPTAPSARSRTGSPDSGSSPPPTTSGRSRRPCSDPGSSTLRETSPTSRASRRAPCSSWVYAETTPARPLARWRSPPTSSA